ncbi:MYXO-CTERM domain-containing protein [Pelomonas saccharophila]|uniref:MYXO-CTERM domain-containing protein n=1 Tax=Roseateles saccharophilus TaxID=304 RepID=A0ABU1YSS9_ROSSA|nr:PEP-CTERM sorting domain-containing protein [Roseateles saccharophilus]MDR7271915.1 MYXO-CTERM domain-containing protein [Roseateles saccharophilus]
MLNKTKFMLAAALVAASQLAAADTAEVKISNLTLSVSGGEWWYYLPTEVGWVSPTGGAMTGLTSPSFDDSVVGWHGNALASSVHDGGSMALAQLTAKTSGDMNGVTASASATAIGGQSAWAFAKVFDGQIMVGGNATITVTAQLDSILATGSMAQANAYIELCSTDFTTDTCSPANFVEAFVDASSPAYHGPTLLTASWTNPGATNWAKMHIGLTASADSVATPVPEPTSLALWLAGLAGIGLYRRRRV